jgi:hypothetical protein
MQPATSRVRSENAVTADVELAEEASGVDLEVLPQRAIVVRHGQSGQQETDDGTATTDAVSAAVAGGAAGGLRLGKTGTR